MKKIFATYGAVAALLFAAPAAAQDLSIWGIPAFNEAGDAYMAELAEKFGEENGLDVEYSVVPANVLNERLAAAFEGNAPPDLFMQVGQQAPYYIARDLVVPLPEILEQMRAVEGGIYESTVNQGMVDGVAYAIPLEVDLTPMYARKDLLADVGMELPKTWEELRSAAQAIVAKNPAIAGFGMPVSTSNDAESIMRMVVWSFGGAMFDEQGNVTWDSPETRAAYQFVADMFEEGTIPRSALTWDDGGNNTAYQTGRTAFTMNPPSIYQWMVENDEELLNNTELAVVPKGPGDEGRQGASIAAFVWMVSEGSDNQDAAKKFLTYFFEPDNYQPLIEAVGGRWVPIYPHLTQTMPLFTETPAFANFDEMATNGLIDGYKAPPSALSAEVFNNKVVMESVQKVLVDGESVEDAVAWAQSQIEALKAEQ
ncbi:MAG: sugar ABC transporter substrate-binding protein [Pseudomonadota bacterium]